jgi:hypothetical protein
MSQKYHIATKPVFPMLPRIGRCGVIDCREDCAGCHNCVIKPCVYDHYRREAQHIRGIVDVPMILKVGSGGKEKDITGKKGL